MKDEYYTNITNDIILPIGQTHKIKLGFANSFSILYSGMPSKDVFTISIIEGYGNQVYSYPLYFPKDIMKITLKTKTFHIVRINEESITIREQ